MARLWSYLRNAMRIKANSNPCKHNRKSGSRRWYLRNIAHPIFESPLWIVPRLTMTMLLAWHATIFILGFATSGWSVCCLESAFYHLHLSINYIMHLACGICNVWYVLYCHYSSCLWPWGCAGKTGSGSKSYTQRSIRNKNGKYIQLFVTNDKGVFAYAQVGSISRCHRCI